MSPIARSRCGATALVVLVLSLAACGASAGVATGSSAAPTAAAPTAAASGDPSAAALASTAPTAGTPAGTGSSASNLDACSILPIDLATQLAGVTMTKTVTGGGTSGSTCTYSTGSTYVTLSIKELADAATATAAFHQLVDDLQSAGGPGSVTPLQGVGDQAVELRASGGGIDLAGVGAVKGSRLFSIETNTAAPDARLLSVAQAVAGKL